MRIAHIAPINFNIPQGRSGPARVCYNLNEALYKINPQILFYGCENSKASGELRYLFPVELNSYEPFNNATGTDKGKFLLQHITNAYAHKAEIDIFQTHAIDFALPIAKTHPDKPTVITLHRPINSDLEFILSKFNGQHIHFVLISQTQAETFSKMASNYTVIPNGVEVDEIPFSLEKEDFFLHVGRLEENKGADLAIQACLQAGVKLVLVGKQRAGNEASETYFAERIQPFLDNPLITYIPEVNHYELYNYYAKARGFIFPLRDPHQEAFGLVSVEAMATGTPAIALDNSLMREVIIDGKTGSLAKDLDGLVDAIQKVDQISPQDCRDHVVNNFSRDTMARGYFELYQRLVN
jgi:glycosyltransferase involved in cell wall biosynthesis